MVWAARPGDRRGDSVGGTAQPPAAAQLSAGSGSCRLRQAGLGREVCLLSGEAGVQEKGR